ncbi:RNA 2'-phosphotransferase [Limosilactobacillus mucosae]|uniref:RNA 2'-phosphotransferase n=1 Tax=Limosilactobacillus mucosae TaxID=97478 RepID=UPI003B4353AE
MQRSIYLSKKISYALRHNPQKYGLHLDEYGYTKISDLLQALNHVHHLNPPATIADLENIIQNSDKERFKIKGDLICALYGHSLPGIIQHPAATPPDTLYHGTARRFLDSINQTGLLPMGRQYVHLSATIPMARQVGQRHDQFPAILKVDAARASQDGSNFYIGNDQVWLCDELPSQYLTRIE